MIFLNLLILVSFLSSAHTAIHILSRTSDEFLVSTAIADIWKEFFIKKSLKFDLIFYGERTRHLGDVADGVLGLISSYGSITVRHIKDIDQWDHKLEDSAIILIKNADFLNFFNIRANLVNTSPKDLKFLIYSKSFKGIQNVPIVESYTDDTLHISSLECFVCAKDKSIEFIINDHFSSYFGCNVRIPRLVAGFNKTTQKWVKKPQNYRIYDNFHHCALTFQDVFNGNFYFSRYNSEYTNCLKSNGDSPICADILEDIFRRPDVQLRGLKYEIFEALGKVGNFKPNYQFLTNHRKITKENIFMDQNITICEAIYTDQVLDKVHMTTSIFDIPFGIYVTPSEFYTNFEKLLLPFDVTIWGLLLATFSVAALVILTMQLMSKKVKTLIYGRGIKTPGLNIVRTFFGIPNNQLPAESILRFILTFFVLFCLIIRTCYQSKMFEFITTDMRKPPPRTLEDVIKQDYTIVFDDNSVLNEFLLRELKRRSTNPKTLILPGYINVLQLYCKSINQIYPKLAFFMSELQMIYVSSNCNGTLMPVKGFQMNSLAAGLGMARNSFLWPIFDDVINKLIPSGILQYLLELYAYFMYEKYDWSSKKYPKVLTFNDLSFGFVLWLTACGISVLGFLIEHSSQLVHEGWKALIMELKDFVGLIFLLYLIRNRLKIFK